MQSLKLLLVFFIIPIFFSTGQNDTGVYAKEVNEVEERDVPVDNSDLRAIIVQKKTLQDSLLNELEQKIHSIPEPTIYISNSPVLTCVPCDTVYLRDTVHVGLSKFDLETIVDEIKKSIVPDTVYVPEIKVKKRKRFIFF